MEKIGTTLREARENAGVSIEEASEDLDVRLNMLEALEAGDFKSFKDVYYLKQLVRDYAKYLSLDADKLVDEFNEFLFDYTSKIPIEGIRESSEVAEENKKPVSPYTNKKKSIINIQVVLYILIGILVIFVAYFMIKQHNDKERTKDIAYYVQNEIVFRSV